MDFGYKEQYGEVIVKWSGFITPRTNCFGDTVYCEDVYFFDKEGNRFLSNFDNKEKAEEFVASLEKKGEKAILGPRAPWHSFDGSHIMPNPCENEVGVYLVQSEKFKI